MSLASIRSPRRTSRSSLSCCSFCTRGLRAAGSIPVVPGHADCDGGRDLLTRFRDVALLHRGSLGGRMSDTERTLHARRADRFWLLGYTTMFLAPSLVLFLIGLQAVASVWLALLARVPIRYFPRIQTPPGVPIDAGPSKYTDSFFGPITTTFQTGIIQSKSHYSTRSSVSARLANGLGQGGNDCVVKEYS